jgi:acyl-CoA hydrolase
LVTVTVEDLSREEPPKTALTAFFTFVSLDSKGKPQPVPALNIYTDDERKAYDEGYKRYLLHKKMR